MKLWVRIDESVLGGLLSDLDWRWGDWEFNIDSIAFGTKEEEDLVFLLAGCGSLCVEHRTPDTGKMTCIIST